MAPTSVSIEDLCIGDVERQEGIDAIVAAAGGVAKHRLYHGLRGPVPYLRMIGDGVAPRAALEAIPEGHGTGRGVSARRPRPGRGPAFDAYLMVDWSGASVPVRGADSIWVAHARRHRDGLEIHEPLNAPTRALAAAHLADVIDTHIAAGARVLVGFDFAFGYPAGFARALRLRGTAPAWRRTWAALARLVKDGDDNANNRFPVAAALNRRLGRGPGPFWNCPAGTAGAALAATRPAFPYRARMAFSLEEYREADRRLRASGRFVQSVWKLYTPGSVGSQTLLGIPHVAALRFAVRRAAVSRVWPFEATSPGRHRPFVLHVEIWPGMVPLERTLHPVKDAAQVLTMVRSLAASDGAGELEAALDRPRRLTARHCLDEEGWILGA